MMAPWATPFGAFFWPLVIWSLVWKGMALWHAARRGELYWFIAILIINTLGILEILYLYVFGGKAEKSVSTGTTSNTPRPQ